MPHAARTPEPGLPAIELARSLEQYLAEHPGAAVVDDGRVLFEMTRASYSIGSDHGRCVLQLWSDERNLVRTVVGLSQRRDTLNVQVRRFGRTDPEVMQFVPDRDTRSPSTRSLLRARFARNLEQRIAREWSDWNLSRIRTNMDLEHSFGPAYARGLLTRGQSAWAVIAVNAGEPPQVIDGILTVGILWLDLCRTQQEKRVVHGLRVVVPSGMTETTASRMAWLSRDAAQWELWEFEPDGDGFGRMDVSRNGNLKTRLSKAFDAEAAVERFRAGVDRVLGLVPEHERERVEIRAKSTTEVTCSCHGLEFARVRHGLASGTFQRADTVTFGAGANETVLNEGTEPLMRDLVARLFESRRPGADRDALFRMQPERWLESELRQRLREIEPALDARYVYSQVPAFAHRDRGMIDLLTCDRDGRLTVIELKADDDMHLPIQGLDYWLRVHQLHQERRGTASVSELSRCGYFPRMTLPEKPPRLILVAPALRIHPANEVVLRYLAEEIEWTLIALGEEWRENRKVVFRKHSTQVRQISTP